MTATCRTGADIEAALETLGRLWGWGRAVTPPELARALRLRGNDPGESVRDWIRDGAARELAGPTTVAMYYMLGGALPPDGLDAIKRRADVRRDARAAAQPD